MKIGEAYDVVSLFSTPERDFLVRNNGDKVKVDSLKGKIVAIYFIALDVESENGCMTGDVVEAYNDMSPKENFEIVLVASVLEDEYQDEKLFNICFSRMPWLGVPLNDKESRNQLSKMAYTRPIIPVCTILDAKGEVLWVSALVKFTMFGAEWYPFTPERIREIMEEDKAKRLEMSVKSLLTSPSRDFLITNDGKKVPVSELEGKVVGFYFYSNFVCHHVVPKLIELYKEVRQRGENFEIVLISSHSNNEDEELFMQDFKSMPWLALPFSDRSYKKLYRIFGSYVGNLVIIRPGENIPDRCGFEVIEEYGIEAYPFTRQRVTEMEVARLKSLTLESILFWGNNKFVIGKEGQKIMASDLVGKSILLLLTKKSSPRCTELLPKVITWYDEIKQKDEAFEMIHISCDYDQSLVDENYGKMPWLELPFDEHYNRSLYQKTLNVDIYDIPMLVAFGSDGRILTRKAMHEFQYNGTNEYPFSDDDLFREIHWDIAREKVWPVTDENGHEFYVA